VARVKASESLRDRFLLRPVEFLGRRFAALMAESRAALGEFVGADAAEFSRDRLVRMAR
jgi:hypothetical protein